MWENVLRAKHMGMLKFHDEVVDGAIRNYVSIEEIYFPTQRFQKVKTVSKEENLKQLENASLDREKKKNMAKKQ